jgi:hypothetical protein
MFHEDASADQEMIMQILSEKVLPVFQIFQQRIEALEEKCGTLEDVLMKVITGMGDAVTEHKKAGLSEMLSSKYGPELEPYKGVYSDMYGKGLDEDLLEQLLGGDYDPDQYVPAYLGKVKEKFGKYVQPAASVTVEKTEMPEETETAPEAEVPAEDNGGVAAEEEPTDPLMKIVKNLRPRGK